VACELELDGRVADLRTVVHDPEFEGKLLDERFILQDEIYASISAIVDEQFGGRIELSRDVKVDPGGSLMVLLVLVTAGRIVIEYGALMAGLRELSRLVPERIRGVISGRRHPRVPLHIEPSQVILGPTVFIARPAAKRASVSSAVTVALSAAGGAALIVAGVLLGHFL
jgi:hypothetical protein